MYCKQCGAQLPEGAAFCGKCGTQQNSGEVQLAQPPRADRYETTVIQVHPLAENDAIAKFELFGWECANAQTVKTKDSHLEQGFGDNIVSVTETETFVKLTFKRRLNMPNYDRLKELEQQYDAAEAICEAPPSVPIWPLIAGIVLLLPFFFIGLPLLIWYSKLRKEYEVAHEEWLKATEEAKMVKYNCEEEARRIWQG